MSNPYDPTRYTGHTCPTCGSGYRATLEQLAVLAPEIRREAARRKHWEAGRQDRLNGEPCRSNHGAYLEGWYAEG